jgi:hypothetical protein
MPARREPVVAVQTFATEHDGQKVIVHRGDAYPASHGLVKGRKGLFVAQSKYEQKSRPGS